MSRSAIAALALVAVVVAASGQIDDLQRSHITVPRDQYKGRHFRQMGEVLNSHLSNQLPELKPCHDWTVPELQALQTAIYEYRQPAHDHIYQKAGDPRKLRFASLQGHTDLWMKANQAAESNQLVQEMQRDGHCHETVMWWVHHLNQTSRDELANTFVLPGLPLQPWSAPNAADGADANFVFTQHYNPSSTCQSCHVGGLPWQTDKQGRAAIQPPPLPRQVNGNDRKRRCDEWYGPSEGGSCGACDGLGGSYFGDLADESIYPSCQIVSNASGVPVTERAPSAYPAKFAVELRGADRWPRASPGFDPACNYTTDCSPIGDTSLPLLYLAAFSLQLVFALRCHP